MHDEVRIYPEKKSEFICTLTSALVGRFAKCSGNKYGLGWIVLQSLDRS